MRQAWSKEESEVIWPPQIVLTASAFKDLGAAAALDLLFPEPQWRRRVSRSGQTCSRWLCYGSFLRLTALTSGPALLGARFDDSVIIQQWVDGVEVSVTVLSDADGRKTLPQ